MERSDYLAHFGIKGMKWGVRRTPQQLGHPEPSRKTRREASKDAKEYARAKMFYGEGAGNRRKLINATVNAKSKRDPMYKKAFEDALQRQDMSKHAQKARSERHRKDTSAKIKRGARSAINIAVGNVARASAAAIGVYSLYKLGERTGVNAAISSASKNAWNSAKTKMQIRRGRKFMSRIVVNNS